MAVLPSWFVVTGWCLLKDRKCYMWLNPSIPLALLNGNSHKGLFFPYSQCYWLNCHNKSWHLNGMRRTNPLLLVNILSAEGSLSNIYILASHWFGEGKRLRDQSYLLMWTVKVARSCFCKSHEDKDSWCLFWCPRCPCWFLVFIILQIVNICIVAHNHF